MKCFPVTAWQKHNALIIGVKKIGVLYLENNLAAGVFTPGHLEVLKVLCRQAAISLENARLYETLADYSHSLEKIIAALNLAQEV